MFRLPETFALTRRRFRDFRPLIPPSSYASPLLCAPHHALARRACDAGARKAAKRMSTPRPAPPNPYSLVSHETREDNSRPQPGERERVRHAPGLTLSLRSLVSASLRRRRSRTGERTTGIVVPPSGARLLPTHVFHVKPASTNRPSPRGDCRARAVSGVCISTFVRPLPLLPPPNSK